MNPYLVIILGALVGTALVIAVQCSRIHNNKSYNLNFAQTFSFYVSRDPFALIVGAIIVIAFLYLFPGIMASYNSISETNTVAYQSYVQNIVKNLRAWSLGIGVCSQGLGFLIVGLSEKKLRDYDEKINK